jgi:cytochrome c-type biogenesis protein CcmH/NrfF
MRFLNLSSLSSIPGAKAHQGWDSQSSTPSSRPGRWFSGRAARLVQVLLVACVVCFSMGATDPQARFNNLGHKMMCTCGCGQVLLECNHVSCPVSPVMRDELSNGIASGMNDSLVLQSFVQRYGATVLAAPTTEGFDLVAWIMPFAVSAMALIGTILLVRNWARNQALTAPASLGGVGIPTRGEDEMQARIRRETETE